MGKCSDKNKFTKLFYECRSVSDLARKLGYKLKDGRCPGGVSQIVNKYIDKYNLDKSHFLGQRWAQGKTRETNISIANMAKKQELSWEEAFSFGSQVHNQNLLKRLVRSKKKKYECEKCKIFEWDNDALVLELHHINGIHHDNEEKNLRILCPNCHSQVERKNEKMKRENKNKNNQQEKLNSAFVLKYKPIKKCSNCLAKIGRKSKTGICAKCSHKQQRKTERPTKEELKNMIKNQSWTSIGKIFKVSDNAVRKWARSYGLLK